MGAGFVGSQKSPGWSSFGENKKKNFVEERLENLNLKYYICKSMSNLILPQTYFTLFTLNATTMMHCSVFTEGTGHYKVLGGRRGGEEARERERAGNWEKRSGSYSGGGKKGQKARFSRWLEIG